MKSAAFLSRIEYPVPNIAAFAELLERQVTIDFANADLGDGVSSFGTMTASTRNPKPFIVGFIAPDNPVNFTPIQISKVKLSDLAAQSGISAPAPGAGKGQLGPDFWVNFVAMCNRLKLDPKELAKVFYNESGFIPSKKNTKGNPPRIVAQGIAQFVKNTAIKVGGVPPALWDTFSTLSGEQQLPYIETYLDKAGIKNGRKAGSIYSTHFGGYPLPGYGRGYMSRAKYGSLPQDKQSAIEKAVTSHGGTLNFMFKAYHQNSGIDGEGGFPQDGVAGSADLKRYMNKIVLAGSISNDISAAEAAIAAGAVPTKPGAAATKAQDNVKKKDDTPAGTIMKTGSITDPNDPLSDGLGRSVVVASERRLEIAAKQTLALRSQIDMINRTPPLVLLINPVRFERDYEQSVDTSSKGRYHNIVQYWLERPFSISCSGQTAGQYAVNAEGDGGITNMYRIFSLSYVNLLSLLMIYKNNGILFAGEESDRGIPILGMSVFIYYDQHIYIGSFDTFSITDAAVKPFNMSYEFRFTVRYDVPLPHGGPSAMIDSITADGEGF